MTLNLNKHGAAMQAAWKAVLNTDDPTDWALFGYEGNTFDLKLVSKGEDGVDEMKEDLNANKIMYAFIRVQDPKTSLPKFVLLNWQGESAPGTRKGMCTTHLRDVSDYFRGAHVTINAREDDEVEESEFVAKVAKASSSSYNFKERPAAVDEAPQPPVGSGHKRIIPEMEIPKSRERENFWSQEQNKEKERKEAEKQRKISEQQQFENERVAREEKDTKRRDQEVTERERKISQMRESESAAAGKSAKAGEKAEWERQQEVDRADEESRQQRAGDMGRQRSDEARKLISQKSKDSAKAVFERNSSAGQMNFRRSSSTSAPPPPQVSLVPETFSEEEVQVKPRSPSPPPPAAAKPRSYSPPPPAAEKPRSPSPPPPPPAAKARAPEPPSPVPTTAANGANGGGGGGGGGGDEVVPPPPIFGNDDEQQQPDVASSSQLQPDLIRNIPPAEPDLVMAKPAAISEEKAVTKLGTCAIALYDYQAADDTEISFDPDQVITNIDQIDAGWWQGLAPDRTTYGLFPANYVELLDDDAMAEVSKKLASASSLS